MPDTDLATLRAAIRAATHAPEAHLVAALADRTALGPEDRAAIAGAAAGLVRHLRERDAPGLMESFLAEYGLATEEGLALMCLAEAALRVPDPATLDALIDDKVSGGDWAAHFGRSGSHLVNASTLGLALTGRVLERGEADGLLRAAARRLGRPVIRAAVARAMREMGTQFVLGETIGDAMRRAGRAPSGVTHSYDMLGEAAMTAADAEAFGAAYAGAIEALGTAGTGEVAASPGISVKLSALHPRYEAAQADRVMSELVPRVAALAKAAREAGIGFNVDAEEADRLDLSLDVIEAVLSDPALAGWDGFGVVVQAYGKRALPVIDWLDALAARLGRRIMVRLVKGAYWDTEIKRAQAGGHPGYPVFTRKAATDVSYLACARALLQRTRRLYPQFATHNAHSVAAILHMARGAGVPDTAWEFQRLHGMGEALHDAVRRREGTRLRVYAPVGRHRELLAYLVRRLLENGANSSFVNRVADPGVPPEAVAADPFEAAADPSPIRAPEDLFAPRRNSRGRDLADPVEMAAIAAARDPFRQASWQAAPMLADHVAGAGEEEPAAPAQAVEDPAGGPSPGTVVEAGPDEVSRAFAAARPWDAPPARRAEALCRAADAMEEGFGEAFALLAREAGKTLPDAVAELREAVDFLRFYAAEAERLAPRPLGIAVAIAPWNFPLAIFTGQVAAALAAGNAVLAKPAEPTPLVAAWAVRVLHGAGVPRAALQFLPGAGGTVGAALVADPRVAAVAFTGSTATARRIDRALAKAAPLAPLVAETGGINAMIVDGTALPEQAVRDAVASAFRSAGQRCSAARILYVPETLEDRLLPMLVGAMAELRPGDPWDLSTDLGPVITAEARAALEDHVAAAGREGRLIARGPGGGPGHAVAPALIRVGGIADIAHEVFGPVLHLATYAPDGLGRVVAEVNASGYGLTMGLHTRIHAVAERVAATAQVGNLYVNRDQIGAVVGSQPFGGEGLSGTGPKAGGPAYVGRLADPSGRVPERGAALLPGPTGEENRLSRHPRGPVLCLGPGAAAEAQSARAREAGCRAIDGRGLDPEGAAAAARDEGAALVAWAGSPEEARPMREALSAGRGPILPWDTDPALPMALRERHVCTDTTAAGGNAALLAAEG